MNHPPLSDAESLARRFLRDDLRALQPYHVDTPPHRIRLDANESPFDLPDEVRNKVRQRLDAVPTNRYPDGDALALRDGLARRFGVEPERLVVGNGSDELIAYLIQALGRPDTRVVSPEPSFSMYRILAQAVGVEYRGVPLDAKFELDADAVRDAFRTDGTNLLFLSYPNNPTGNCWNADAILSLLDAPNALVVLDEAYAEFSRRSFVSWIGERPNLIVLRTFSKAFGLAGLRVGYMLAHPSWVECVNKVRLPYNVNRWSQEIARIALAHASLFEARIETVRRERDRLFAALADDRRFEPFRSDANFVLFRVHDGADDVFRRLVSRGILVRNLNRPGPLSNCLRVTAGTAEDNDAFLAALAAG